MDKASSPEPQPQDLHPTRLSSLSSLFRTFYPIRARFLQQAGRKRPAASCHPSDHPLTISTWSLHGHSGLTEARVAEMLPRVVHAELHSAAGVKILEGTQGWSRDGSASTLFLCEPWPAPDHALHSCVFAGASLHKGGNPQIAIIRLALCLSSTRKI